MSIPLEITLIVVLAAIALGLVPLLFQLRHTVRSLDAFLRSATKDLGQIAEDVHASRVRMDHLADSLQPSVDEISSFAHAMGEVGRAVKEVHTRVHSTLESASRNWGGILEGISAVLTFFNHRQPRNEFRQEQRS